jgi:hypothetical protein
VEIKQKKTIQCNLCVIAGYLTIIRVPENEQYSAVPGQEILKLLGCKDICIEYLQRFFIKGKRKINSKHENAPVLDNSCRSQKACYRKIQKCQVPSLNGSNSYYFLYKKEPVFFVTKGSPHE